MLPTNLHLTELFPYLTWNSPLADTTLAASLARIIVDYLGKAEITLIASSYSRFGEERDFQFTACCVSTYGSLYLIQNNTILQDGQYDRVPDQCEYRDKNLKYFNTNTINTFDSNLDGNYMDTMTNCGEVLIKQKLYQNIVLSQKNYSYPEERKYLKLAKRIKVSKICVIDTVLPKNDNYNRLVSNSIDFHWKNPIEPKITNAALIFATNMHDMFQIIGYIPHLNKYTDLNIWNGFKVQDLWQYNKEAYFIAQEISTINTNSVNIEMKRVKLEFTKSQQSKQLKQSKDSKPKQNSKGKSCKMVVESVIKFNTKNKSISTSSNDSKSKNKNKNTKTSKSEKNKDVDPCAISNISNNCNYYDADSQTLLIIDNTENSNNNNNNNKAVKLTPKSKSKNKKIKLKDSVNTNRLGADSGAGGGVVIRLIYKNPSKKKEKAEKAKAKTKAKETKRNKNAADNDEWLLRNMKISNLFLRLVLKESKCHYLFHHEMSEKFILLLKLKNLNDKEKEEKEDKLMDMSDLNANLNDDDGDDNKSDMDTSKAENKEYTSNEYDYDSSINMNYTYSELDTREKFLLWKKRLLKYNNGRLLIQIGIDFNKKKIVSLSIGNIVISEKKCRIIGYDHTRSLVIYDTLSTKEEQKEAGKTYYQSKYGNDPNVNHSNVDDAANQSYFHTYKMIRLNDLVSRWISIF